MIEAAATFAYEQAFRDAVLMVRGDIVAFDAVRGASLRVTESVRGSVRAGSVLTLDGSAGYSFLAALPTNTIAFASRQQGDVLQLWKGPTSGGLIWSEPGLIELMVRAHADPRAALRATEVRERLAGAYFLVVPRAGGVGVALSQADTGTIVVSAAWGLANGSPSTHQAAVDVLDAIGFSLPSLGIAYHPNFKPELKTEAAARLNAWWERRR